MKQAVMTAPGVIVFRDVDIPKIGKGEVLVKIKRIGVCGSDVHVYHGKHPFTSYPVVQGHEVAGEIAEVAPDVSGFKKGDRVTIQPQVVCGTCYPCRHGAYHICDNLKVMGFQTTGMASEYFAVDSAKVLKLSDSADFDEIAVIEPIAVACHCLKQSDTDLQGANIVVFGAGPIGNLVAQTAKAKGARVLITDISDFRLELAKQCGIDYTVNTRHTDVLEAIIEAFGQDKADLILDCAGNQTTVTDAVRCARKGTDIIMVAVVPDEARVNLGLVQDRELRIIGTLMYQEQDYLDAIELLCAGKVSAKKIITYYFDFEDYDAAYRHIEQRADQAMKVMICMPEE